MVGVFETLLEVTFGAIPAYITALWGKAPLAFCIPFGGEFKPSDWIGMLVEILSI